VDCNIPRSQLDFQIYNIYNTSVGRTLILSISYRFSDIEIWQKSSVPILGFICQECTLRVVQSNYSCPYCDWAIHRLEKTTKSYNRLHTTVLSIISGNSCNISVTNNHYELGSVQVELNTNISYLVEKYNQYTSEVFIPTTNDSDDTMWIISDSDYTKCGSVFVSPENFFFQQNRCSTPYGTCTPDKKTSFPANTNILSTEYNVDQQNIQIVYSSSTEVKISIPLDWLEFLKPSIRVLNDRLESVDNDGTVGVFSIQLMNEGSSTGNLSYSVSCMSPFLSTQYVGSALIEPNDVYSVFITLNSSRNEMESTSANYSTLCIIEFYLQALEYWNITDSEKYFEYNLNIHLYYGRFVDTCGITYPQAIGKVNDPPQPVDLYSSDGYFNMIITYVAGYFVTQLSVENIGPVAGIFHANLNCNNSLHSEDVESIVYPGKRNTLSSSVRRYSDSGILYCQWHLSIIGPIDECWSQQAYFEKFQINFRTLANDTRKGITIKYSPHKQNWFFVMLAQVFGERPQGLLIILLISVVITICFIALLMVTTFRQLLKANFLVEYCV
jgi:hypothetical protein